MTVLWMNLRANFRKQNLQRLLIFLTLVVSSTLFTIGVSLTSNVSRSFVRAFESARGAHIWIKIRDIPEEYPAVQETLEGLPGILELTEIRPSGYIDILIGEKLERVIIQGLEYDPEGMAQPVIIKGRPLTENDKFSVLVDWNWARLEGIEVGDKIEISTSNGFQKLTVIGLSINYVRAPYSQLAGTPINFLPISQYEMLMDQSIANESTIGLRLAQPQNIPITWQMVREHLGELAYQYDAWQDVKRETEELVRLNVIFLTSFSIFSLLASGLIIGTTISNAVLTQSKKIGLLRAIGLTGKQVTWLFLVEYLLVALLSSLVGFIIGLLSAPLISQTVTEALNTTYLPVFSFSTLLIIISGTVSIALIAVLWPSYRAGSLPPVEAIQQEFNIEWSGSKLTTPVGRAFRLNLPFSLRLGINEASSVHSRKILNIFNIALTTFALVFSIGVHSTVSKFVATPALFGPPYDAFFSILPGQITSSEVESILVSNPDVTSFFGQIVMPTQIVGTQGQLFGIFREGDPELFAVDVVDGRMFALPGEIVISQGLARTSLIGVGDTLNVTYADQEINLSVVGIASTLGFSGQEFVTQLNTLSENGLEFPLTSYYIDTKVNPNELLLELIEQTGGNITGQIINRSVPVEIQAMPELITGLTFILMLVTLLGTFNTLAIDTQKHFRKFAILKSVGVTPRQIILSKLIGTGIVTLLVAVVSIPIGVVATYRLLIGLARLFNYSQAIPLETNLVTLTIVPFVVVIVALLGAFLPSLWASRVNPDSLSKLG